MAPQKEEETLFRLNKKFDFWILLIVLILLSIGIIMVFSASGPTAQNTKAANNDIYHYLKNQLIFAVIGLGGMFILMNLDYKIYKKFAGFIFILSIILLIAVFIPGIGKSIKGARRWINIPGTSFQPSEFAKFAIVVYFAAMLSRKKTDLRNFVSGLCPYIGIIILYGGLLFLEPHMSGFIVIALVGCIILFAAGAKIKHFLLMGTVAVPALAALAILEPYRLRRLTAFIDPFADPQNDGWQIVNALYAIGSGGLFGRGLGQSLQKYLYLPEPQNDFILAVIGEELGFVGVVTIIFLFCLFFWRGTKVAMQTPDMFGSLLAIGIVGIFAVQVVINIAVVTSSMPVTGMQLPFFSAGGSSLTIFLCEVGILLNISGQVQEK